MKKHILFVSIIFIAFFIFFDFGGIKLYAQEFNETQYDDYMENVRKSTNNYQLIYDEIKIDTLINDNKEYDVYADNYGRVMEDGIEKVIILESYELNIRVILINFL